MIPPATVTDPRLLVEFDGVWLDDRQRCAWALCDVSFAAYPGGLVALVASSGGGAAEAVLDLLSGRRLPVRGRVSVDGLDLRDLYRVAQTPAVASEHTLDSGERAVTIAGSTVFVAQPCSEFVRRADAVISFAAGFVDSFEVRAKRPAFDGVGAAAG